MVQGTFDDLGTPLSSVTFVVVDLETTGGSPAECGITEIGAVKVRGGEVARRVPDPRQPRRADPGRSSRCSPASPTRWSPAPRASRPRCRRSSSSPRARCSSRTTPGFDIGFLKAAAPRAPSTRGRASPVARHRAPGPPARAPATRCPTTGWPRWPGSSAPRPRPTTARCTTPAPPSTCCTACSSGSAPSACTPSRSCSTTPPGSPRRSAASATWPTTCPTRPGSTSSRTASGRVLYVGTSARPPHPRALLLHRLRAPQPDGRDGAHRRVGQPHRLRHHARGARCASCGSSPSTSRATTAAPATPSGRCGSSSPSSRSPGCRSCAPCATTAPATSGRSAPARPPRPRSTPCTRSCRCASAPSGSPRTSAAVGLRLADMGRCGAPCTGAQSVGDYALRRRPRRDLLGGDARDLRRRRCAPASTHLAAPSASRTPRWCATGWSPSCGAPRAPSGSPRWPASPSSSPPGAAARRLGGRLRPLRPARRQHHLAARCRPDALHRGAAGQRRGRRAAAAAACRCRRTAEETEMLLRWLEPPGCASSSSTATWTCPVGGAGRGAGRARAAWRTTADRLRARRPARTRASTACGTGRGQARVSP